jgi:hypothetical protein
MTKKTPKLAKQAKPPKRSRAAKPANRVTPAKRSNPAKPTGKTYIVYGADEYAKPRAARFSADDPELLAKAVATMHLRMAEVTTDDLAEIATKLPAGRLHANGRGLVPYIRGDLYLGLARRDHGRRGDPGQSGPHGPRPAGHLGRHRARPCRAGPRDPGMRLVGGRGDRAHRRPGHGPVPRLSAVPTHGAAPVGHRADQRASAMSALLDLHHWP